MLKCYEVNAIGPLMVAQVVLYDKANNKYIIIILQ
jgi:hypothetical protein